MKTAERRNAILKLLQNAEEPVAARKLAERYGVSRQVIVQDMAVIRAYTPGIISTTKGYVMEQEPRCVREFKVRHKQSDAAKELNLIVDCGGRVCNISISHRVYGRVSAEMDIRSRQDVAEFIAALNDSQSTVLSTATSGSESDRRTAEIGRFSGTASTMGTEERGIKKMTIAEIQQEIMRMKKEQDICILAHAYQGQEILEVADYMGDSYGLSVQASKSDCKGVIMCGVRFMAETCKVLSPDKKVWLANPAAGCPMAEQLDLEGLREIKAKYPDYAVVAYINTTSELKTECDVCVTSSSAVQICSRLDNDKILFIPDPNLGRYVAEQMPEKTFAFYNGGCPRHIVVSNKDVEKARKAHPNALLLVHPECRQEVVEQADYVGSTTGIMNYARKSDCREFIIGTENSIVEHLQFDCPDKSFYPLAVPLTCMNMKITTLMDIYNCLKGQGGEEIQLPENVIQGAGRCIRRMVELGE